MSKVFNKQLRLLGAAGYAHLQSGKICPLDKVTNAQGSDWLKSSQSRKKPSGNPAPACDRVIKDNALNLTKGYSQSQVD